MDDLESKFLEQLEADPADLEGLAPLVEAVRADEPKRAREWIALWDDTLREKGMHRQRWDLLLWQSRAFHTHPQEWDAVVDLYGRLGTLPGEPKALLDGLHKDYKKFPARTLQTLDDLTFLAPEMVVRFQGKPARVVEINYPLKVVKVRPEGGGPIPVPFGATGRFIERLTHRPAASGVASPAPPPAEARARPAAFLRALLKDPSKPVTLDEIRELVRDILEPGEVEAWWKRCVQTVPLMKLPSGRRMRYRAAERPQEVLDEARVLGGRERLSFIAANAPLFPALADGFKELAREVLGNERPEAAYQAFKTLAKLSPGEAPSWDLLFATFAPRDLYETLPGRERLTLIPEIGDPEVLRALFLREDNAACLGALWERVHAPALAEGLMDRPDQNPAAWLFLMDRLDADPDLAALPHRPLDLLAAALNAYPAPAFGRHTAGLNRLWEPRGAASKLLKRITPQEAAELALLLDELEEMKKGYPVGAIRNRLLMDFPELKQEEAPLWCTARSLERKRAEIERLLREEIPAIRAAVKEAREQGDLRENYEYKAAREKHAFLEHQAATLDRDLKRARVLQLPEDRHGTVYVGSTATLADPLGNRITLTILGPWESDPNANIYSYESDAGKALLEREAGDRVVVLGQSYIIESIKAWNE
jgi:transcription elongation GreA/GreB family factor